MVNGPKGSFGRRAMPVSSDDLVRVVSRALARTGRIRLTSGQRRAILHAPVRPGAARA